MMPEINPNPRVPDDDSLIQGGTWFSKKIESFIAWWTPKCNEMTHLISEEMDSPLPWFIRFKMRVHYMICCYCARYKTSLHYLRCALRHLHDHADEISTAVLPSEAKQQLKQALRDDLGASQP